jgi:disulfide bond formation protein DsbB
MQINISIFGAVLTSLLIGLLIGGQIYLSKQPSKKGLLLPGLLLFISIFALIRTPYSTVVRNYTDSGDETVIHNYLFTSVWEFIGYLLIKFIAYNILTLILWFIYRHFQQQRRAANELLKMDIQDL